MDNGYAGKILSVDLTSGNLAADEVPPYMLRDLIGGYGIGARLLLERMPAGADPLGPDNILGFFTGPLTGTPALFGNRYTVFARSPLTLTWGDANSGGDFGPYLKFAGYDGMLFSGVSERPCYLLLDDGCASLSDASNLWGKDCYHTEERLKAEHGAESRVACIGPAGEKLSLISAIINDRGRAAGRSGLGAVMGSKRLKAIVVKGSRTVPVADGPRLHELARKHAAILAGPNTLRDYGTAGFTSGSIDVGDAPVRNWGGTVLDFPNGEAISDQAVLALQEKRYGCWRCPLRCGGEMKAGKGEYRWSSGVHKPEYETLAAFGSLCLNDNLPSIIALNDMCNRYGLDTISTGAAAAFAIECYENGIIDNRESDGLELAWGDHHAIVDLVQGIAARKGLGDVLADGVQRAAERVGRGAGAFAMHIGGQEAPMHDPRCKPDYGTTYLSDATPGRHTQGHESFTPKGLAIPGFDRRVCSGRGAAHKVAATMAHAMNASGMCLFGYACMEASALPDFLTAVTGWEYDLASLQEAGERIACLRQVFNAREGLNPLRFPVPGRISGYPPQQVGPLAGRSADLQLMGRDFYLAMGWDLETGRPSPERLRELGLTA